MQKRIDSFIEKNTDELENFVKENRELSAEEKIEIMGDKIEIPVNVHRFGGFLEIGEYEIKNSQFAQFAYYILNGGYDGWAGELPDFAKSAVLAIRLSRGMLFKSWYS